MTRHSELITKKTRSRSSSQPVQTRTTDRLDGRHAGAPTGEHANLVAARADGATRANMLLGLQRMYGNSIVGKLVGATSAGLTLQRCGPACDCAECRPDLSGDASMRTPAPQAMSVQRRTVCDEGGACWEEEDNASYPEPNASYPEPNVSPEPNASYPEDNTSSSPVAAATVTPLPGPVSTPLGPVEMPTGPVQTPLGPVEPPGTNGFSPSNGASQGAQTVEEVGVEETAAEGAGETALEGLAEGAVEGGEIVAGSTLGAIAAGALAFLWPSSTAPAWMDEINPITGQPYRDEAEYNEVRHLSPAERESRRAALSASETTLETAPRPPELSQDEREAVENKNNGRPYDEAAYNRAMRKINEGEKYRKQRNIRKRQEQ